MLNDVLHQDEAVRFLRRVVDGHAVNPFLLVGPEGVGRRFACLQAVKELFCSGDGGPRCGCVDCLQVDQAAHPDLTVLSNQDGKDIGVDAVRQLIDLAYVYPTQAKVRVILLDGADRMTAPAANALLKTLEEPPSTVRFFLLAESTRHVLPTILSRCGLVSAKPLPESFLLERLSALETDPAKALVYARLGEGSLGRSIHLWGSGRLAFRDRALAILTYAVARDVAGLFQVVDEAEKELPLVVRFITTLLHDVLLPVGHPAINTDIGDKVMALRVVPAAKWCRISDDIHKLMATYRSVKIQLPFHLKSILLDAFLGA